MAPNLRRHIEEIETVTISFNDVEPISKAYRSRGFELAETGYYPNKGTRFCKIGFQTGSLELLGPDDSDTLGDRGQEFFRNTPRPSTFVIRVESLESVAEELRAVDIPITLPAGYPTMYEDREHIVRRASGFYETVIPGHAFFFEDIEPRFKDMQKELDEYRATSHENSATKIRAVWIQVEDIETAEIQLEEVGLPRGHEISVGFHDATIHEISLGAQSILLYQPDSEAESSNMWFEQEGTVCVSIEVDSLRRVNEYFTDRPIETYDGPYGTSILIPMASAGLGISIEFYES